MRFAGEYVTPEELDDAIAGVINMRDPRSQIEGTSRSGMNPEVIRSMEPGTAQDVLMRRLKERQGAVSLPGFLGGV